MQKGLTLTARLVAPWLACLPPPRCAGPKHKLAAPSTAKQAATARTGGAAGRGGSGAGGPPPAKREKKMSVKDRLKKKLQLK